jgi:gamma-glutamyl phosphate reductase
VRSLYKFLVSAGADAWLDEEKLLPGQLWEQEIPNAVRASDAIVVCLSRVSISKRGYIQKEIRAALDVADEHPEGALFLIPAKLEECEIPERLAKRQWVNLFQPRGNASLLTALKARATQLCVESVGTG